eukprot:1139077-Pelagomonas_calceolata.AAC.15
MQLALSATPPQKANATLTALIVLFCTPNPTKELLPHGTQTTDAGRRFGGHRASESEAAVAVKAGPTPAQPDNELPEPTPVPELARWQVPNFDCKFGADGLSEWLACTHLGLQTWNDWNTVGIVLALVECSLQQ